MGGRGAAHGSRQHGHKSRPGCLWLKQIVDGNREAFETLYGEYPKRLFRYFVRLVSVTEAAEELTNDVLVEVCKKAGDFRGLSKVSTWIFGGAHYKAMNEYRAKKPVVLDIEAGANEADPGPRRKNVPPSFSS